jgi:hypothetical protein
MTKAKKYSPAMRERAVRLVFEHQEGYASQWGAISSIAEKIGCTPETLRGWGLGGHSFKVTTHAADGTESSSATGASARPCFTPTC